MARIVFTLTLLHVFWWLPSAVVCQDKTLLFDIEFGKESAVGKFTNTQRAILALQVARRAMQDGRPDIAMDAAIRAANVWHEFENPSSVMSVQNTLKQRDELARGLHALTKTWLDDKATRDAGIETLQKIVLPNKRREIRLMPFPVSVDGKPHAKFDSLVQLLLRTTKTRDDELLSSLKRHNKATGTLELKVQVFICLLWCERGDIERAGATLNQLIRMLGRYKYRQIPRWIATLLESSIKHEALLNQSVVLATRGDQQLRDTQSQSQYPIAAKQLRNFLIRNHAVAAERLSALEFVDARVKEQMLSVKTPFEYYAKRALSELVSQATDAQQPETVAYAIRRYFEFVRRLPSQAPRQRLALKAATAFLAQQPARERFELCRLACLPIKDDPNIYLPLYIEDAEDLDDVATLSGTALAGPFALLLQTASETKNMNVVDKSIAEALADKLPDAVEAEFFVRSHRMLEDPKQKPTASAGALPIDDLTKFVASRATKLLPEGSAAASHEPVSRASLAAATIIRNQTGPSQSIIGLFKTLESHALRTGDDRAVLYIRSLTAKPQ